MTGTASIEATNKQLYRQIGDFLLAHQLAPNPANYILVHQLVTDDSSCVAQAIQAIISDGVRLTQRDASRILEECGDDGAVLAAEGVNGAAIAAARCQVDDFNSIVEATQASTKAYERDLARGAAELDGLDPANPAVMRVAHITAEMLVRTRAAEEQLAAARMEAQSLREQLAQSEQQAMSDPLTRLPNRRAFEDKLKEMQAKGGTASLAICDIDRFKTINDSHGHPVGDRVLRMVADVLRANCATHMVARIGGEEFVVLFEGLEPAAAAEVLDQARSDLGSRSFKVRETDAAIGRITFSAGVARCSDGEGDEAPMKRADILLYKAKNGGRNQVIVEAV